MMLVRRFVPIKTANAAGKVTYQGPFTQKMSQRHRQRADVVVMAMRDHDRVHVVISRLAKQRQAVATLAFRVHARVEQQPVLVQLHQPGTRADVGVGIQVRDVHEGIEA